MNEHIALIIKTVRIANGLTQAEFAEKLEVTPGHIGSLEQGSSGLSVKLMGMIVKTFNVDANIFFGKTQQETISLDANAIKLAQNALSAVSEQLRDYARISNRASLSVDDSLNESK